MTINPTNNENNSEIQNDSDILCFCWMENEIICCFSDKKTYIYFKSNKILQRRLIRSDTLYCQFLYHDKKVYCAKAFGGIDIYENESFSQIHVMTEDVKNCSIGMLAYQDYILVFISNSILIFQQNIFHHEYIYDNYLQIYNLAYDPQSKSLIVALLLNEKYLYSYKKIDAFIESILNNQFEYSTQKDYVVDKPISAMAIQKGGKYFAVGLYDGKIIIYKLKELKNIYKQELEFSDIDLNTNFLQKHYATYINIKQNQIAISWSVYKLGFYDIVNRCEISSIKCENSSFNFVSFSENEQLFYFSQSLNNIERTYIKTIDDLE